MAKPPGESRIPVFRCPKPNLGENVRIPKHYHQHESTGPPARPQRLLGLFSSNRAKLKKVMPEEGGTSSGKSSAASSIKGSADPSPTLSEPLEDLEKSRRSSSGRSSGGWSSPRATSTPVIGDNERRRPTSARSLDKFWLPKIGHEEGVTAANIGHRVCVGGQKVGTLRYYGEMELGSVGGFYCGVELNEPAGLNDGSVQGVRYFTCKPQHGIFAPVGKVRPLSGSSWHTAKRRKLGFSAEEEDEIDGSGPYSLLEGLTDRGDPNEELLLADNEHQRSLRPKRSETFTIQPECGSDGSPIASAVSTTNASPRESWNYQRSGSAGSLQHQQQGLTTQQQQNELSKQSSFELDESSLGILTPDQMLDFTVCEDSPSVGRTPSFEDMGSYLLGDCGPPFASDPIDVVPNDNHVVARNDVMSLQELEQLSKDITLLENQSFPEYNVTVLECDPKSGAEDDIILEEESRRGDLSAGTPATATKSSDEGDFTPASIRGVVDISDRTLSPEDLPMDAPYQEVVMVADKTELTSESGRDTAGLSGATSAGPSSRSSAAPPLPVGFVTSVTSITSLDNGYQGDGEWSRPASRGADHSPTGGPKPRIINNPHLPLDPMTDSDFFTESDADMHEDNATTAGSGGSGNDTIVQGASTGVGRGGDRKAQVIDGTLYGAAPGGVVLGSQQHQLCPAFTASSTNEEMESSGVYSDLERRPEETNSDLGGKEEEEEEEEEEVIATPEGSTKTVSSHSDQSQVVAENNLKNQSMSIVDSAEDKSLTPVASIQPSISPGTNNKTPTHSSSATVTKHTKEEGGSTQPLKKYKMPKRNVGSKIKAMIESSANPAARDDENQENRRPGKPARKFGGGRWDAVMSKIEQGKADDKLKPSRLKEVKSKVLASISSSPSPPRKTSNTNSSKTRRGRSRASPAAQQQSGTGVGVTANSATSSQHSSLSDVSQTCNSVASTCKSSTSKAVASLRTPKKQQQQQQQQRDVGRSTSPLSDGSTNSAASHHLLARSSSSNHLPPLTHPVVMRTTAAQQTRDAIPSRERVLRDKRSENNRNNISATNTSSKHRTSRTLPSSATSGSKGKLLQTRKATAAAEEKNGVSVTPSADMKTQTVRKQASRRGTPTSVAQKPTPLRDHNRQPQQQTGGGVLKEAPPPSKQSRALPQPTPAELLLPQLRHNSAGFEALGILVQYLVYNLDAFATPQLKKELDTMKTEWLKTKLELEEVQVSYRRVEDCLAEEKVLHRQKLEELVAVHCRELTAHDAKHSKEMAELVSRHEAQITEYEKRFQEQLEEMKGRYEGELCKKEREHKEKLEGTISEWQTKLEQLKHDHDVALTHQQADAAHRENELNRRLAVVEEEYSGLKDQSRRLMESMQKDKDTKLQATAGRCRELQEEVDSLRSVLDLRHKELQELRLHNAKLTREAEELPVAQQRVAALEAKVEDLQVQLQRKTDAERQLAHEYRMMMESLDQESKQNKRLSLHNEELQWKLKQNSEVVNVLAALSQASMNSTALATTLNVSATSGRRSNHGSAQSLNENPARPVSASSRTNLGEETSPPSSPKVKAVIEKSDSVSWVLEMDETSDMVVSRLVRRAGSFRGATPPPSSSSSPAHARTLPPPKRQRCKASSLSLSTSSSAISRPASSGPIRNTALSSSLRARSRSVSTDGGETEYSNWKPETSTPHRHSTGMQHNESFESEDDMMMLVNGGKRCSEDDNEDTSLLIHGANTTLMKRLAASEGSNDEDSPSKSAGSSGSSEAGSRKDSCHRTRKQQVSDNLTDPSANSDSLDLGDTEVLPLPPLPGSTSGDLSLLAAQPLPPMLKESGGEAMISEETSEDENDNEEVNSSSEEQSCSDDETTSSESSSDLGQMSKEGKKHSNSSESKHEDFRDGRALQKRESSGQQNLAASTGSMQQYHLLMMSDNGSYSATTTTMDISWSEDMELMPSESEG